MEIKATTQLITPQELLRRGSSLLQVPEEVQVGVEAPQIGEEIVEDLQTDQTTIPSKIFHAKHAIKWGTLIYCSARNSNRFSLVGNLVPKVCPMESANCALAQSLMNVSISV